MFETPSFRVEVRNSKHQKFWYAWAAETYAIRNRFSIIHTKVDGDPFSYNETASVSLLANAASRLGLLTMCDYREDKIGSDKKPSIKGRVDLYVTDEKRASAFEAKSLYEFQRAKILDARKDALKCANQIDSYYEEVFGLVIANHFYSSSHVVKHRETMFNLYDDASVIWTFPKFEHAEETSLFFFSASGTG